MRRGPCVGWRSWRVLETSFFCQACGHESLAWSGRCAGCGEWNTLVEAPKASAGAARGGWSGRARSGTAAKPVALRDVAAPANDRLRTGIAELDRVLGGGLVPGSLVLLGGSPGIGKSTLTGMALGNLGAAGHRVLYVSGEESTAQVRLRAERLGEAALAVAAVAETSLEAVVATLEAERPDACVIDSIQTLHAEGLSGSPGSVGQVREAAGAVMEVAKRLGCAVVLVGHVTKEGAVAGPRVLEHLVDCVLFFEGERERSFRTLRALKNRFGATSEVGVFEMRSGGLVEVEDPSARFVAEASAAPGSVVLCSMEGTRPLLVEVQALVAPTEIVPPRRVANGIDRNRLAMILAVLARHGGPALAGADVFVNVAGGVRVDEPGADLAVALALVSAHRGEPLADPGGGPLACFGEVGLTGELRAVGHADRRLAEATKFGLGPVIGPAGGERVEGLAAVDTLRAALQVANRPPVRVARLTRPFPRCPHGISRSPSLQGFCHHEQVPHAGDELNELDARQDPRLVRALDMVAPGTPLREGIENIIHARTGGLILVADADEVSFLFSGGLKLDVDYTPGLLYQVAKMDGAIVLPADSSKISWANVQLMPDPTILSMETGTRHRTAERVSKQTNAVVIAISQRRDVVSLYVEGIKYILQDIPTVLSKANQGLATLEKYRARLDQVEGRLTALEFARDVVLHDPLLAIQRAELVTRMAAEVERYIIELGTEGRLIEMQLEETVVGVMADRAALVRDYSVVDSEPAIEGTLSALAALDHTELLDFGRLAELCGYDRKTNTLEHRGDAARLSRALGGAADAAAGRPEGGQPLRRPRRPAVGVRRRPRVRGRRRAGPRAGDPRGHSQASGGRHRRPLPVNQAAVTAVSD